MLEGTVHQLDQQWSARYRTLRRSDYLRTITGPFSEEEQQQWDRLSEQGDNEQLNHLAVSVRDREVTAAINDHREPCFRYPTLECSIEELRQKIRDFQKLDDEIQRNEPHPVVRDLYHEAITEQITVLKLRESTYTGDNKRFWELSKILHLPPSSDEMMYALQCLKEQVLEGFRYEETVAVSFDLLQWIREHLQLSTLITDQEIVREQRHMASLSTLPEQIGLLPERLKHLFELILQERGYRDWRVEIDARAGGASVHPVSCKIRISNLSTTEAQMGLTAVHEIVHIDRAQAGAQSSLALLGVGTAGYDLTEEGLALYRERLRRNERVDDPRVWLGLLCVGLAVGILVPPQRFTELLRFMELYTIPRRLIERLSTSLEDARTKARQRATLRALRIYKGVPDLTKAGIASTDMVVYLRGRQQIEEAVAQDATIIRRLMSGKFALHQLEAVESLGIVAPSLEPLDVDALLARVKQQPPDG